MIHIGSDAGLRGEQPIGAYSVSKAALVMMSQMLALDGAAHGVRSNCVCPGATAPGMRHIGPASDPDRGDDPDQWPSAPLGGVGTADDVASAVVYLASAQAGFVSGAVLLIDGANGAGSLSDRTRNSCRGSSSPARGPPLGSSTDGSGRRNRAHSDGPSARGLNRAWSSCLCDGVPV